MLFLFWVFFLPGLLRPQGPARMGPFMLASSLAALAQGALVLVLLWRDGARRGLRPAPAWGRYGVSAPRAADLLPALGLFAAVAAGLTLAALALGLLSAPPPLLERGFRYRLPSPRLLPLAVLFALATAYKEELLFRCYLITRLRQWGLPAWAAAALSTALFAAGHLYQGVAGFAVAALLGSVLAWRFLRRGNLHQVALAHALYNLAVLAATLLADAPDGWPAGHVFTGAGLF